MTLFPSTSLPCDTSATPPLLLQRFQYLCNPEMFSDTNEIDTTAEYFRKLCINTPDSLKETLEEQPELVKKTDNNGQTLLHYLATNRTLKYPSGLISVALAKGALVTAKDNEGLTPIHRAFYLFPRDSCIYRETLPTLFMAVGEKPEDLLPIITTPDPSGNTLLHLAAKYHYDNGSISSMVSLLIMLKTATKHNEPQFQQILNTCNGNGWTVLEIALGNKNKSAIEALHEVGITLPKRSLQEIDQLLVTESNQQILPYAEAEMEQIKKQLELCSSLDEKIQTLHYIFKRTTVGQSKEFIVGLLRKEIDALDTKDINYANTKDGYTFLHVAALAGDMTSIQKLLDKGAQTAVVNHSQVSPIEIAALNNYSTIYKVLKEKGAQWTVQQAEIDDGIPLELHLLFATQSAEIAQDFLIQYNIQDVNKKFTKADKYTSILETTMLKSAFMLSRIGWLLLLLQKGASIESLYKSE